LNPKIKAFLILNWLKFEELKNKPNEGIILKLTFLKVDEDIKEYKLRKSDVQRQMSLQVCWKY